jgi:5-methylcytosine-specific restriction enzyme subunit McrC
VFILECPSISYLPRDVFVKPQEPVHFDASSSLRFDIDLVLYDATTLEPLCVMDTKYKVTSEPAPNDLAQVVAYAEAKGCNEALLVYPTRLSKHLDTWVGDIRVRSLAFSLKGNLDQAGQAFIQDVFAGSLLSKSSRKMLEQPSMDG